MLSVAKNIRHCSFTYLLDRHEHYYEKIMLGIRKEVPALAQSLYFFIRIAGQVHSSQAEFLSRNI